jgi:outer membrane protein
MLYFRDGMAQVGKNEDAIIVGKVGLLPMFVINLSQFYYIIEIHNIITYLPKGQERRSTKMGNAKRQSNGFLVAVLFLVGVVSIIGFSTNTTYAAAASSAVGVVNYQLLVSQHPDTAAAQKTLEAAAAQAKSDFDAKSAGMSDQDKQALYQQIQQGFQQKNQELLGPINDKVMAAVKSVADAKGLTIIVDEGTVVYGGQDITDDVMKVITGK